MDVDANVTERGFFLKYGRDCPSATLEQTEDAYNEYKDFYIKYHQDNPGAATDCYAEYIETLGKQGTPVYWENRGATGICAILQERQLGIISWGRAES